MGVLLDSHEVTRFSPPDFLRDDEENHVSGLANDSGNISINDYPP